MKTLTIKKFKPGYCPHCGKKSYVTTVDSYEPGHLHYACEKVSYVKGGGGCGTTWRERKGIVIKSSIDR